MQYLQKHHSQFETINVCKNSKQNIKDYQAKHVMSWEPLLYNYKNSRIMRILYKFVNNRAGV